MEMSTCHICGKIYGSSGDMLCSNCRKLADIVYEKARAYLRDNPKKKLHAAELAAAIKEDVRIIEILVLEGRFSSDPNDMPESADERKRRELLESLQKNLASPADSGDAQKRGTYGSDRHGRS